MKRQLILTLDSNDPTDMQLIRDLNAAHSYLTGAWDENKTPLRPLRAMSDGEPFTWDTYQRVVNILRLGMDYFSRLDNETPANEFERTLLAENHRQRDFLRSIMERLVPIAVDFM